MTSFSWSQPLAISVGLGVASTAWCYLFSLISGNCSQVDRLWSLLPVAYSWIFAYHNSSSDTRVYVMAFLVTLWGVRLTYNFWRKGGYKSGSEDYRWPELRKIIS